MDALGAVNGNGETCAVIVANLKMIKDGQPSSDGPSQEPADNYYEITQPSDWATAAVGTLANGGIMKGTSETTLSPLDNTTVEQAIMLVLRVFELVK